MALDFPSSPTNGQAYGNYIYSSATGAWKIYNADNAVSQQKANLAGGNTFIGNQTFSSGYVTKPGNPVFTSYSTSYQIAPNQTMPYNSKVLDTTNSFNTSNYRFTAPVAGAYMFSVYDIGQNTGTTRIALYKNGVSTEEVTTYQLRGNNHSNYATMTSVWIVSAAVGDYFTAYIYDTGSHGTMEYAWFSGFLIG